MKDDKIDEDDLHQQMIQAYLDYFKAVEKWHTKNTHRGYYDVQRYLRKIRKVAYDRNQEIKKEYQAFSKGGGKE